MEAKIPALKIPLGRLNPHDLTGSGVLIDPQGILVTGGHVVATAKEVEVELPDGRRFLAKKFRHDPAADIAVVWLDVKPSETLPFVRFGDSDQLNIGDWVLSIGSPFELDSTVCAGIISAKGRSIGKIQRSEVLQTDAAIHPGTSGGPLINLRGEVIGISSGIASQTGAYEGIGFAMPSNNIKWVTEQLVKYEKVIRAWLGVETRPVTLEDVRQFGLSKQGGLVVDYPLLDSPAEAAGFLPDDVILSFNGQPVNAVYQLERHAERAEIGKAYEIIYIREGKEHKATVTMKPLPPQKTQAIPREGIMPHHDAELGLVAVQATEQVLGRLRWQGQQGLLVLSVAAGSRAEQAGITIGTLIVSVDGKPVPNRQQYIDVRNASSLSNGVTLEIRPPGGESKTFVLKSEQLENI